MRIVYADEEDFQNAAFLWEANQERSIKGRKGQAALRRLEAALLAMPEKELAADVLEDSDGKVCALAALAKHEGYQGSLELPEERDEWGVAVENAMLDLAAELKVPKLVAVAIITRNDEGARRHPAIRYDDMLRWVQRCLRGKVGWLTK